MICNFILTEYLGHTPTAAIGRGSSILTRGILIKIFDHFRGHQGQRKYLACPPLPIVAFILRDMDSRAKVRSSSLRLGYLTMFVHYPPQMSLDFLDVVAWFEVGLSPAIRRV